MYAKLRGKLKAKCTENRVAISTILISGEHSKTRNVILRKTVFCKLRGNRFMRETYSGRLRLESKYC